MIQLSHPFIIEKPVLIRQSFVVKVMSLFFNMLSRLVIALLPMSKCIFVSWVQILEPKKIKSVIVSIVSPSSTHEVKALYATILFFFNVKFEDFHSSQEDPQFLFTFSDKGGDICISEVIDISPRNIDSSLCFI